MKEYKELVQRVISLLFPPQRKWIAGILVIAGISTLSAPFWEPYLNAALAKHTGISVQMADDTTGWILLVLGIVAVICNVALDYRDKGLTVSVEDASDRTTLSMLFSELHMPTLDAFISYGKTSMVYIPILHYFFGVDAVVKSSAYHLHDPQLKEKVENFHAAWSKALSFGEYFAETSNVELQKFDSRRDVNADPQARNAHDVFIQSVWDTERHIKELFQSIRAKYPDFDLRETDQRALEGYISHEESVAKKVSDWDFSVLGAIIELEEQRILPTLQNLTVVLAKPSVNVQAALDKLIRLDYAKHLYRGSPYQKFTTLPAGRAYYVSQRDVTEQY